MRGVIFRPRPRIVRGKERKMKIYIVTDGSYSDYSIRGVYSTKEKAELAHKLFAAENDVEEYKVDNFEGVPDGMFYYEVKMDKEGNTEEAEIKNYQYADADEWQPYGDDNVCSFSMWAKDKEHAIKIANERRIRLIESGSWTTSWEDWKKQRA
jgi:hypothetical protein